MLGAVERAAAQTSPPAAGASFEITPHHAGISVLNLEESVAWYQRMLDFEVVRRVSANPNVSIALMRRGSCFIELLQIAGHRHSVWIRSRHHHVRLDR